MIQIKKGIVIALMAIYIGLEYYTIQIPSFVEHHKMSSFDFRLNALISKVNFQLVIMIFIKIS